MPNPVEAFLLLVVLSFTPGTLQQDSGILLDESHEIDKEVGREQGSCHGDVCHDSHALGKGFFVPSLDLMDSSLTQGSSIFKELPEKCFYSEDPRVTRQDTVFYKDTSAFMKSLTSDSGLESSLETPFTLGVTVDAASRSISGASRSVTGLSLILYTLVRQDSIVKDCYKRKDMLDEKFVQDFEELEKAVENPWLIASWTNYDAFLREYGSHFANVVKHGVSYRHDTFSESVYNYTRKNFSVRACLDFAGQSSLNEYQIKACSNISDYDKEMADSLNMTMRTVAKGGRDDTRAKILYSRSPQLVEKFLGEAREYSSPVSFEFSPVYSLLRVIYHNTKYITQVNNLENYFHGFLNYECTFNQTTSGIPLQQFVLDIKYSTKKYPQYACILPPEGCHADKDCHFRLLYSCYCQGPSCIRHTRKVMPNGKVRELGMLNEDDYFQGGCVMQSGLLSHSCECDANRSKDPKKLWTSESIDRVKLSNTKRVDSEQNDSS